jgi:hypothetical protein
MHVAASAWEILVEIQNKCAIAQNHPNKGSLGAFRAAYKTRALLAGQALPLFQASKPRDPRNLDTRRWANASRSQEVLYRRTDLRDVALLDTTHLLQSLIVSLNDCLNRLESCSN